MSKLFGMFDLIRKKIFFHRVLGISREEHALKISLVTKEKNQVHVSQCMTVPLVNKEAFRSALVSLQGASTQKIATGLESHEVVFRSISLPLKSASKVLDALPFQLEALLPFSMDQAIVCPFLKAKDSQCTSVSFIATSKDLLKKHLSECVAIDFHPDVVTCTPIALFRLSRWLYPEQKNLLFFHFDEHITHCIVIQEGRLVLSQSMRLGKSEWKNAPSSFKERLANELERMAIFMKEKIPIAENTPWALVGEITSCEESTALWKKIFSDAQLSVAEESVHTHALSIGFALDALANDAQRVQFLQREFLPRHHLQARKKRGLLYAAACLALSVIIGLSSTIALQKKTKDLSSKLQSYFPSAQNKKTFALSEIDEALAKSETSLLKAKNGFPFFLTIPKVSEVLAWLSTHPAFTAADGLPKEGIEIKAFRYQLTKFPTLEEPAAPYQATVDLEFTATAPRFAREFHDALLKGDRIVNAKKELKWNTQGNNYSVQFELNKSATP